MSTVPATGIGKTGGRLPVTGIPGFTHTVDLVLVVVGIRPDTALAQTAGVELEHEAARPPCTTP